VSKPFSHARTGCTTPLNAPSAGRAPAQNSRLGLSVLEELEIYKIPAFRQTRARLASDLRVVLFSKSGFGSRLQEVARERDDLELIGSDQVVPDLLGR
jgi:hypothetical protein